MNKILYKEKEKLKRISITDNLTGLYNHGFIFSCLEKEIKKAKMDNNNFTVTLIDIDNFKSINDTYGHLFGDQVLKKVSETIKNNLRNMDLVGRYGGEEFLIILPKTKLENGYIIAERIRRKISELKWEQNDIKVTISDGVLEFNNNQMLELLKEVDTYLYRAKKNGKNRLEKKECYI